LNGSVWSRLGSGASLLPAKINFAHERRELARHVDEHPGPEAEPSTLVDTEHARPEHVVDFGIHADALPMGRCTRSTCRSSMGLSVVRRRSSSGKFPVRPANVRDSPAAAAFTSETMRVPSARRHVDHSQAANSSLLDKV
jgi:hypothetical protein